MSNFFKVKRRTLSIATIYAAVFLFTSPAIADDVKPMTISESFMPLAKEHAKKVEVRVNKIYSDTNKDQGVIEILKHGPSAADYGSKNYSLNFVIEDYDKQDFLVDEFAKAFEKYSDSNKLKVKYFKPELSKTIAKLFPSPENDILELQNKKIRDYSLIAFDSSGRVRAVMFRWFSTWGRSYQNWVQYTYVIDGSLVKKVENALTATMLKDYELAR